MSDTTILEGPDGRLYEIPTQQLATYAVPGERVAELRRRMAGAVEMRTPTSEGAAMDANASAGVHDPLPPGHSTAPPPGQPGLPPPGHSAAPPSSMSIHPGQGVVLNFYFGGPPPAARGGHLPFVVHPTQAHEPQGTVEPYHMSFDDNGIPVNHTDMLWGDYIDKQGNAAVGWHSHDPVTGNAQ